MLLTVSWFLLIWRYILEIKSCLKQKEQALSLVANKQEAEEEMAKIKEGQIKG
jgi:hypothetical protein